MINALFRVNKARGREFVVVAATAMEANVPLERALQPLAEGVFGDGFASLVRRVIGSLAAGHSFSWCVRNYLTGWLPAHWPDAIAEAEAAGHLPATLHILSRQVYQERDDRLLGVVRQLVVYFTVMTAVISVLCVFILPKFAKIYAEMAGGFPPPASTELFLLLASSATHSVLGPIMIIGIAILLFAVIGNRFSNLLIRLPILGRAARLQAAQEAAHALATALDGRVDLPDAVEQAAGVCRFSHARTRLLACADRLRTGAPWVETWRATQLFDAMGDWVLSVNARTPQRGFATIAAWAQDQLTRCRRRRLRYLELAGTLICASLVLLTSVAIYDALFTLIHHASDLN